MNNKNLQLTDFEEHKLLWRDTYYIVKMNNKWGIFNNYNHKFLINPEYDSLRFYSLGANWDRKVEHIGQKETLNPQGILII